MKEIFRHYLFQKHILVADDEDREEQELMPQEAYGGSSAEAFATMMTLAKKFSIRIVEGQAMARRYMIRDAADILGEHIPEPFYRGFPQSVRNLAPDELLLDQLYHYSCTYGMGDFDQPGHSTMEEFYTRIGFNEHSEPKDFRILDKEQALEALFGYLRALLEGNRPLNPDQEHLIAEAWEPYRSRILPDRIPCKDTVIMLLYQFKDLRLCRDLKLSDVIKLLNYIQYMQYGSENLKKLNLKNQDRKLICRVLDCFFAGYETIYPIGYEQCYGFAPCDSRIDIPECFEKRKIWCGMLHHIHYKPKTPIGSVFCNNIRSGINMSHLSHFEAYMRNGEVVAAAKYLKEEKGESALVRSLNYILSRCKNDTEREEVLKCL